MSIKNKRFVISIFQSLLLDSQLTFLDKFCKKKKFDLYDSISMRHPCDIQELILASFIFDTVSEWSQFLTLTVFLASKVTMYMSETNFT